MEASHSPDPRAIRLAGLRAALARAALYRSCACGHALEEPLRAEGGDGCRFREPDGCACGHVQQADERCSVTLQNERARAE